MIRLLFLLERIDILYELHSNLIFFMMMDNRGIFDFSKTCSLP